MLNSVQHSNLWNHNLINDIIKISFDNNRYFSVSISTQVLKLASRYLSQSSKDVVSCVLIGCCDYQNENKFEIIIDRIECSLATYLCDNQLISSDDICIPLKCFKSKKDFIYSEDDYKCSIKEIFKNIEDESMPLSISKMICVRIFAGFNDTKTSSPNLNWIKLKLIYPDLHLTLSPINKLLVFRSALVSSFENQIFQNPNENVFSYGYLTMDHSNKLHFLLYSDDRVAASPLVGVWVHGELQESNLIVFVTCMKYVLLQNSSSRICKPPFPFLLAHFTGNKSEPIKYFDVKWPAGPSEDQVSVLKFIKFKLQSGADNLDKYYKSAHNQKLTNFSMKLTSANENDKAWNMFLKVFKDYLAENCSNSTKDDTIPRNMTKKWSMMSNDFSGLEVPDVSLLINDTSSEYNLNYKDIETKNSSSKLLSNITVEIEQNEAIPRPFGHQQRVKSTNLYPEINTKLYQPGYPQLQYFPQHIYPYPTMLPGQPSHYLMYPPNMFISKQDSVSHVLTKPPHPPKTKYTSTKTVENHKKIIQNSNLIVNSKNKKVDRSVITDLTNETGKISKRILQLDREEDLATLENLVQQIINQRNQIKPSMVSVGTNTSIINTGNISKNLVEVSTDLPSFVEMKSCEHCFHAENSNHGDNSLNGVPKYVISDNNKELLTNELEDNSKTFSETKTMHIDCENTSDEGQHFDELLKNLESFVEQVRYNSFHEVINETECDDQSKINILDSAVRNLRELSIDKDFENQYWETLQSTKPEVSDNITNETITNLQTERCSLDVTILQQKINYVSIFLNNTSILTLNSTRDDHRRSSISEQSTFIEDMALKYLSKASSKLNKLRNSNIYCENTIDSIQSNKNFSIATEEYLRRYNLNSNINDTDVQNTGYYSSIRLPNGNSLPKNKILVSSTPAPHGQQLSENCFKKFDNQYNFSDNSNGSYVRILDGLKQQPSILPVINQSSLNSWPHKASNFSDSDCKKYLYSEEIINVLDVNKLKQLPKYL